MSEVINKNHWEKDMREEKVFKTLECNPFRYMVALTLDTYKAESQEDISKLQLEFTQNKIDSLWIKKKVDSELITVINFIKSDQKARYTLFYIKTLLIYYDHKKGMEREQERELFLLIMLKIPYSGFLKRMGEQIEIINNEIKEKIEQLLNRNDDKWFDDKFREDLWENIEEKFTQFVNRFISIYIPEQKMEYYDEIMEAHQVLKEATLNL